MFEFRSEFVRGIWANQNMELLYYSNENDERYSIQVGNSTRLRRVGGEVPVAESDSANGGDSTW